MTAAATPARNGGAAATATPAVYGGVVREGEPVVVIASRDRDSLRSLILGSVLTCDDGSWIPVNGELAAGRPSGLPGTPSPIRMSTNAAGRFTGHYASTTPSGPEAITLTIDVGGRLGTRSAHGWFSMHATVTSGSRAPVTTCDAGDARYTAAREPGAIFGGSTTQSEPLVVRFDRDRHTVDYFGFSWGAACSSGAHRHWGLDGWRGLLRASARGSFARSIHQTQRAAGNATEVYDYGVSGRIRRRAATGRLWARYVIRDQTDTAVERCNTPPLAWRALSG